jgi:Xaa-Pro aminopeptidase
MSREMLETRSSNLRRIMRKRDLSWLILTSPANVTYVTGFMGEDSWALIGLKKSYLLTDSRYSEEARKDCSSCTIVERKEGMVKACSGLITGSGAIGVDDAMTVVFYELLRKTFKGRAKRSGGLVEILRQTKEPYETRLIVEAAAISWQALKASLVLRVGMTESELAGRIEFEMRKLGTKPSFDTIVAFGANASQAHYKPAGRKLRADDTILIDFGVRWKGYCSDTTRCFGVGKATTSYRQAYQAVLSAHQAAVAMLQPGAGLKNIDQAARKTIIDCGFPPYGHGLGHGLGLEVHEGPVLSSRSEGTLSVGQVVTVEPGIYIPGKLGLRLEDDYLITAKGCRLLSGGSKRFALGELPILKAR